MNAVRRQGSRSPLEYVESLLAPDGSVRYSRTGSQTPVWVTAQALTAIAGKPFPILPVRRTRIASSAALTGNVGLETVAGALAAALAPVLSDLSGAL